MKKTHGYELPDEQMPHLRHAIRLEVFTLIYMSSAVVLMGLVMGNSQAMRTAWIEDMLGLIPPTAFLIASRIRHWPPTDRFPYGYHRAVSIAYLVSAVALMGFGLLLIYEAVSTLVRQHHPTVGSVNLFGHVIWQGWLMLPVLAYSAVGPAIIGRLLIKPAHELHDKVLYAGSQMLKADWLTAGAAMLGIMGIALGWWWADAMAAAVISLDVLYDGWRNLRAVIGDLMDRAPETADLASPDPLPNDVAERIRRLPWVRDMDLRMRESGHVLFGNVFIIPVDERDPIARTHEALRVAHSAGWRVNTVVVQLVQKLDGVSESD